MIGVGCEGEIIDQLTFSTPESKPVYFVKYIPPRSKVVVTGFGPFRDYSENPSSIIIDELAKENLDNITFELHKMSVAYEEVSQKVPELWETHNPDLVIHLGAHSVENTIKFEQRAFSDGYCSDDVNGCTPENNTTNVCCAPGTILISEIDCAELATFVNNEMNFDGNNFGGLICELSEDPGRYLCGFSYFLSLNKDAKKSLFVHVPPFTEECTKEKVKDALLSAIKHIVKN
ncbi:unnamed protein product [Caenorhabditis angaria]|uniref:Uncharacterized protein n=1 Tax=Caenorhabditis angaria TaxID=860376 RepID=A0A9P1I5H5_9PELO|nr:unnamed protein product [Caenorhabditis angaria]